MTGRWWIAVAAGVVLGLGGVVAVEAATDEASAQSGFTLSREQLRTNQKISIAAVKLGARRAVGIEVDEEANEIARVNAERNGVADRVEFLFGDAAQLAPMVGPAEVLCSNILRLVNVALLPEIRASLVPGGVAIFSGMEVAEAPEFRAALAAQRFTEIDDVVDAGWWGVAARP